MENYSCDFLQNLMNYNLYEEYGVSFYNRNRFGHLRGIVDEKLFSIRTQSIPYAHTHLSGQF